MDENPNPLAGSFKLTKVKGRADVSMRVRVDKCTNIRAIAKVSNGEYHMVTNFVKARGGCSAPLGADLKEAMKRLGNMRFRTLETENDPDLKIGSLQVSHPQFTGMQLDQKTRLIAPAHFIEKINIYQNDVRIIEAEFNFSISVDPAFRFFFTPTGNDKLRAEILDSEGQEFTQEFPIAITE